MAGTGSSAGAECVSRIAKLSSLGLALGLAACGSSDATAPPEPPPPSRVMPAGRLVQPVDKGPITHVTVEGWRTRIDGGTVTIQPPAGSDPQLQYQARRMRDLLGTHDLRGWSGERRSLLLPGGAKLTLHGQGGEILRLSLYDVDESHEIDVLTQTLMHSRVDAAIARTRDGAEADGETAHLLRLGSFVFNEPNRHRLHLANLYVQPHASDGTPQRRRPAVQALARQNGPDLEIPAVVPAPVAEIETACTATTEPRGRLVRDAGGQFTYVTGSGLWTLKLDQHTITLTRSGVFTWQVWGDPHENLNGKHVKDWLGTRRTLLLDDGTRITMHAEGPHGVVHTTSVYDGAQSHEIGNIGNVLRHSCVNAEVASSREAAEADGETLYLVNLRGPAMVQGYLYGENVYTETAVGDGAAEPEFVPVPLGETGDHDTNPNQVNDLYDDPRLGHT